MINQRWAKITYVTYASKIFLLTLHVPPSLVHALSQLPTVGQVLPRIFCQLEHWYAHNDELAVPFLSPCHHTLQCAAKDIAKTLAVATDTLATAQGE